MEVWTSLVYGVNRSFNYYIFLNQPINQKNISLLPLFLLC